MGEWIDNPDNLGSIFSSKTLSFFIMKNHFRYKGIWICRNTSFNCKLIVLKAKDIEEAKKESVTGIKKELREMIKSLS